MKKLSVSPISNSAQFFPKKGTLEFLQLQHRETTASTIISLIGPTYSTSTIYVLYGVVNSGTYPAYVITAGAVFYNGEIYDVDAASFTATGSNVAVFSTVQTQYATDADPCTFSDATTHNIHNIIKMQLTAGASGSGLANYSAAVFLNFSIPAQLNLIGTGQAAVIGAYPDLVVYVPAATNLNPVLTAGTHTVGDITPTVYQEFTVTLPLNVGTANYYVMGCMISTGTPVNDCVATWTVRLRTATNFVLCVRELVSPTVVQALVFEYVVFAK